MTSRPPSRGVTRRRIIGAGVWLVVLGVALWVPQYFVAVQVKLFIQVMCIAIAAIGLNLLTGYAGLISIGHGAFMGVGAYATAILVVDHGWSHGWALFASMALTFVLGALIGLPALRIRGLHLALATLAFGAMFPDVVKRFSSVTGGPTGKRVPKITAPDWSGMANDQWQYYVILVLLIIVFVAVRNIVRSRVGRALVASRDNETAAEAMGVNLAGYRVATFGISAMLAGMGGALGVWKDNFVEPRQFSMNLSITLLVAVVIGGTGTLVGPVVGAFAMAYLPEWVPHDHPELSPVISGAVLIVLMLVAPAGIVGTARRIATTRRRPRPDDEGVHAPPGSEAVASESRSL